MRRFLANVITYVAVVAVLSVIVLFLSLKIQDGLLKYNIPSNTKILVLGNSHTECAINDQVVTNVYNLSDSGETYFFSYLKLKKILKQNLHIQTVVMEYSYRDFAIDYDSYIRRKDVLFEFLPAYLFMMNLEDFKYIYKLDKRDALTISFSAGDLTQVIKILFSEGSYRGGYVCLKGSEIEKAKKSFLIENYDFDSELSLTSQLYIKRIYDYLQCRDINLILLHTPMHPFLISKLECYEKKYYEFAVEVMPEARIVNHANFNLPEVYYHDLNHLNYKGARVYSKFLRDEHIFESTNKCKSAEIFDKVQK